MKRKSTFLFIVLILALVIALPAAAGISGPGVSGIQIQNLDTVNNANVTVELWNQTGAAKIPISSSSGDTITKGTAKNYYLPNFTTVPDGSYAMVVASDKEIAALARTDWSTTGGAAIYVSTNPGTDVTIPLVVANYVSQTTQFTIQNTNTANAINDVKITLNGRGSSTAIKTLTNQSIPKGTSKTYNLADSATWGTLPDNALDTGASGFVGSVRIQSATPLVVQSFIDLAGSRSVSGFSGVPTSSAAGAIFCPLIRANYYGDTGISIVNPNATDMTVNITFYADKGSPNQGTYYQSIDVSGNSSSVAFQGPTGNSRAGTTLLPGGSQNTSHPNYTNDGFYGVAKLESTSGSFLAVVNDTKFASNWSTTSQSTYNCLNLSNAGTQFALPLIRKYHLSSTKLTTGVQIQNVSGGTVTVSMDIYNWDGTRLSSADPADVTIGPYGSGNFWQGNLTNVPTVPSSQGGYGWYGSAILTISGTGDVVAVVNDEGFGATKVDTANYEALLLP